MIKPAAGFSQKLVHAGNGLMKSRIEGPYGQINDIGDYGSTVMFAIKAPANPASDQGMGPRLDDRAPTYGLLITET